MGDELKKNEPGIVRIVGRSESARAYAIRDFLGRGDVPFEWIEVKTDEQARQYGVDNLNDPRLPICLCPTGTRLENPTIRQLADKLGWYHDPSNSEYDLAIYGAGPAGLSAAVYGASEGLKTVLIERSVVGGQAGTSSKIENYLGFPDGISGADLAKRAREQACRFGTEILMLREGVRGEFAPGRCTGYLADGTKIVAHATICSTGVRYRKLNLENEDKFQGVGVYYGAGVSEATLCEDKHVVVVGGGNSAGQASMHFARFAKKVTIVIRADCLRRTLSQYLVDRIHSSPNIEVLARTEVSALHGDHMLQAVTLRNNQTGEEKTIDTSWLFLCLGGEPQTEWAVEPGIVRDSDGYLVTGPDLLQGSKYPKSWPLERSPYYLETNVPGLFAAGDVRHGSVKRCASAVGEGAMAVTFVHRYLAET
jgi:thioredoxin reductase (NADPH)